MVIRAINVEVFSCQLQKKKNNNETYLYHYYNKITFCVVKQKVIPKGAL